MYLNVEKWCAMILDDYEQKHTHVHKKEFLFIIINVFDYYQCVLCISKQKHTHVHKNDFFFIVIKCISSKFL